MGNLRVNSHEARLMFSPVAQPVQFAESFVRQIAGLHVAADVGELQLKLARAMTALTECELSQVYQLDAAHTRLNLSVQCLAGDVQKTLDAAVPSDYWDEQLLQFSLSQNRPVCLQQVESGLHSIEFLPAFKQRWSSLLCVPLAKRTGTVNGLLLLASTRVRDLSGYTSALSELGQFFAEQAWLLQRSRPLNDGLTSTTDPRSTGNLFGLIGESPAIGETRRLIAKVISSPYTVLLTGETGTGKEVVARAIHEQGPRKTHAFVVQNCAAVPENLLESELFGYRKGAFTGADRDRRGLFDAAEGGTLLLDEIGDMPMSLQAKLLRVLQEGEIRPLGANSTHKINVRIIAATHRNLPESVAAGSFREDLYYRLMQFPIELPPLRQRQGDVRILAQHFAEKACIFLQRDSLKWAPETFEYLAGCRFPGNVRELKGAVERAVLMCDQGVLLPAHFSLLQAHSVEQTHCGLRQKLDQVERDLLIECLRKNRGNQTQAARELALPRRTLIYRLSRLNIHYNASHG
jgi:sigma-54-dependent transcriptional regulator